MILPCHQVIPDSVIVGGGGEQKNSYSRGGGFYSHVFLRGDLPMHSCGEGKIFFHLLILPIPRSSNSCFKNPFVFCLRACNKYLLSTSSSSSSSSSSRGGLSYELYAVRNKTLVLKFARVDAVLDLHFILKILIMGRLCCSAAQYEKRVVKPSTPICSCYSYYDVFSSFSYLGTRKSPAKFNQFFIVPPRSCG